MKTYQDLQAIGQYQSDRMAFIETAIQEHKTSAMYKIAFDAEEYDRQRNVTIISYQKLLYTISGQAVPDNYTANHKVASNFFHRFVTQENQYLLGNGMTLDDQKAKEKLGADFDTRLQQAGRNALVQGVAFGFWNNDHLEVFKLTEFVPLYDEENAALMAGIRFWQVDRDKPLRATLYELDGYTDYIKRNNRVMEVLHEKRTYKQIVRQSEADGTEILDGENYPRFPIVPLWGNEHQQSELVGLRQSIDCYDLIKSGFANDLDDASMIYWTLNNAGGMDDIDLAKFVERMKTVKAAVIDGDNGTTAEAHTIEVPYMSRVAYLEKLENDMYNDFQALNVAQLSAAQKTATEIRAAYQPLDNKVDHFEYCILDFLQGIFVLAGIEGTPTFQRSRIANQLEETQMVLMAAQYLDDETVLKHLPWLTPEEVDEILKRRDAEDFNRFKSFEDDSKIVTGFLASEQVKEEEDNHGNIDN